MKTGTPVAPAPELPPELTLYTVSDIARWIPKGTTSSGQPVSASTHERTIDGLLEKHGTYVDFGGSKLLTIGDFVRFLDCMRRGSGSDRQPASDEPGIVLVMGDRLDPEVAAYVDWVRPEALTASERRISGDYGLMTLGIAAMTYGAFVEARNRLSSARLMGKLYTRTGALNEWLVSTCKACIEQEK